MKKIWTLILALIMALAISACASGEKRETTAQTDTVQEEMITDATQETEAAKEEKKPVMPMESGETHEQWIARLFDPALYDRWGENPSAIGSEIPEQVQIFDRTFRIGMTYSDIVAQGLVENDVKMDSDAEWVAASFHDPEGHYYHMGMSWTEGQTAKEDGKVVRLDMDREDMFSFGIDGEFVFSMGEIDQDTSLEELASIMGDPWYLAHITDEDEYYLDIGYTNQDFSKFLKIRVDVLTNEIIRVNVGNIWR